MIEVTLTNTQRSRQARALSHHANRLDVMHARLIQRIHLSTRSGELTSWADGPNSMVLYLDDDGQGWYFSGRPLANEIRVRYGSIPHGRYATYVLKTRRDVDKFCEDLGI